MDTALFCMIEELEVVVGVVGSIFFGVDGTRSARWRGSFYTV